MRKDNSGTEILKLENPGKWQLPVIKIIHVQYQVISVIQVSVNRQIRDFSNFRFLVNQWRQQTCGSRDLSLGLETSRDSGIKVLVLVLGPLSLGLWFFLCHIQVTTHDVKRKNEAYKLLHPLLEKVFATPATSAPVERIFNHSGLLMALIEPEWVTGCCHS